MQLDSAVELHGESVPSVFQRQEVNKALRTQIGPRNISTFRAEATITTMFCLLPLGNTIIAEFSSFWEVGRIGIGFFVGLWVSCCPPETGRLVKNLSDHLLLGSDMDTRHSPR